MRSGFPSVPHCMRRVRNIGPAWSKRFDERTALSFWRFSLRTLRTISVSSNIALTAPYMHDGSIGTLEEVVDHYAAGGRTIGGGPFAGVGHDNPAKDKLIHGFFMTPQNRADLVAFLVSPTDKGVTRDEKFADSWLRPQEAVKQSRIAGGTACATKRNPVFRVVGQAVPPAEPDHGSVTELGRRGGSLRQWR